MIDKCVTRVQEFVAMSQETLSTNATGQPEPAAGISNKDQWQLERDAEAARAVQTWDELGVLSESALAVELARQKASTERAWRRDRIDGIRGRGRGGTKGGTPNAW